MPDEPSMNDLIRGATNASKRGRREQSLTDRFARQADPGAREDRERDDDRARDRAQRSDA